MGNEELIDSQLMATLQIALFNPTLDLVSLGQRLRTSS
jgi:hypothetical protein